jgi:hypothetical protein
MAKLGLIQKTRAKVLGDELAYSKQTIKNKAFLKVISAQIFLTIIEFVTVLATNGLPLQTSVDIW